MPKLDFDSMPDMPEGDDPIVFKGQSSDTVTEPTVDTSEPVASGTDTTPPSSADATAADAETPPAEGDGEVSAPAQETEPDPREVALVEAAKALGIDQTDVAKLPAAIVAKRAELDTQRQAAAEKELTARRETIKAQIAQQVDTSIAQLADATVKAHLQANGYDTTGLTGQWWLDPNNAAEVAAYREIQAQVLADPAWANRKQADLNQALSQYEQYEAQQSALTTKYPSYPKDIDDFLVQNQASAGAREELAKLTSAAVDRKTSTLNSEVAALRAENAALAAKVSGFDKALADAKTEGLNAAIKKISVGDRQPNTTGVTHPTNDQAQKIPPRGKWLDAIPELRRP